MKKRTVEVDRSKSPIEIHREGNFKLSNTMSKIRNGDSDARISLPKTRQRVYRRNKVQLRTMQSLVRFIRIVNTKRY